MNLKLFSRGKPSKRPRRVRAGDIIIILVLAAIIGAMVNYSPGAIIDFIYSPVAGVILVVMILEFLWLKSGDRTRVYRIEIDRLRSQRRRDEDLLRRAHEIVDQAIEYPESEEKGRPGDWRQKAIDTRKDISDRL